MATSWLKSIKVGVRSSVGYVLRDCTDYVEDPDKTNDGELVSAYQCSVDRAANDFMFTIREYEYNTGRDIKSQNVIAYHTRQAFKPGEITPEEANRIGYETAMRFTKGKHQFIVATHIDKAHIHNHIIFCSVDLESRRKFRNFWNSSFALRRLSDQICVENKLSIIENPQPSKSDKDKREPSHRQKLREDIGEVLQKKPADFSALLRMMEEAGYEVKPGKHIAFRAPDQERFIRLRSLGEGWDEESLRRLIADGANIPDESPPIPEGPKRKPEKRISFLIDLENNIKAMNSPGYEQWAKIFNLKQMAQALILAQENQVHSLESLKEKADAASGEYHRIQDAIQAKSKRLEEISGLQKHISAYRRTRDVYTQYRKNGYSKKFFAEHEAEILQHQEAKKVFDALHLDKLPTIADLKQEYAMLLAEKKKLYQSHRPAREAMMEWRIAQHNIEKLLDRPDTGAMDSTSRTQTETRKTK